MQAHAERALLMLDFQESICRENGEIGKTGLGKRVREARVLTNARAALAEARARGFFIAYSRLAFDDAYAKLASSSPRLRTLRDCGMAKATASDASICSEIAPGPDDLVVEKVGIDPFVGTPLLAVLIARRVHEIVLAGVSTQHVVESAARHGADLGFDVVVLSDLCAAHSDELQRHALEETLPFYARVCSSTSYFGESDDDLTEAR